MMNSQLGAIDQVVATTVLAAIALSCVATGLVRRFALARSILDVPNHRSSHTVPTPRGGGAAILLAFCAGLASLATARVIALPLLMAIGGGSLVIAAIGWLDDRRSVSAGWRAGVQFVVAAWALFWLGGMPSISVGSMELRVGMAGSLAALVGIVWCTNLYNFMDGIDGIAGSQAVTAGLFGGILLAQHDQLGLASIAFLTAGCSLGFLFWNWAPAKIFMGDVGSGMLGFILAAIAVAAENAGTVPLVVSALLVGPFVLDATLTLFRRLMLRERWYEAHRSHAYQRAVQSGLSHSQVSAALTTVNSLIGLMLVLSHGNQMLQSLTVAAGFSALFLLYLAVERRFPMRDTRTPEIASTVEPVPAPSIVRMEPVASSQRQQQLSGVAK